MAGSLPTVYLVEDDEKVRIALGRLLTSEGYGFQSYANAEEFLQHHDLQVAGCAVVDLDLPGMDGFGVQDILTSGATVRPVVFLTGTGTNRRA